MERWERRDRKRRRMKVSGAGLRDLWMKIVERSRKLKGG
jgi:hypothetical protein